MLKLLLSRDAHNLFDALMRYVPSGVVVAAAPDATILRVSDHGSRMIERPRGALEGISAEEHAAAYHFRRADSSEGVRESELPLTRAVTTGEVVHEEEWILQDSHGHNIPVQCNAGPIRDDDGRIVGGILTWADLSRQKALEARLRESLDRYERLLRETHHRIKNQLQIIASLVQMEAVKHGPACEEFALNIQRRLQVVASAHEGLYRSETFGVVDAGEHLRRICGGVDSGEHPLVILVEAGVELNNDQAAPVAIIVNEAVDNALKHAFPEGRSGRVEVVLKRAGSGLELTVSDDGVGPGETDGGNRLGLILTRGLAKQLGGDCTLSARPGGGALFRMTFPTRMVRPGAPADGSSTAAGA